MRDLLLMLLLRDPLLKRDLLLMRDLLFTSREKLISLHAFPESGRLRLPFLRGDDNGRLAEWSMAAVLKTVEL